MITMDLRRSDMFAVRDLFLLVCNKQNILLFNMSQDQRKYTALGEAWRHIYIRMLFLNIEKCTYKLTFRKLYLFSFWTYQPASVNEDLKVNILI